MSASLVFEPIIERRKYTVLSDRLKYLFREKFNLSDGPYTLDKSHLLYLEGLVDGGAVDAQKIVDCLKKHNKVSIWLEY